MKGAETMSTLTPAAESLAGTSREYVENPAGVDAIIDVLAHWHNDPESGHTGAFATCDGRPCYAARRVATDSWKGR